MKYLLTGLLFMATPVFAQEQPADPWETARFRMGGLAFTPSIQLKSLGLDTNVFNEVRNPKSDITSTLGPKIDAWLRLGRARLHAESTLDGVWFKEYATERSINTYNRARLELRLHRITPYVSESFDNARARPGFEIDARTRYKQNTLRIGSDVRVSRRLNFDVSLQRALVKFDGGEVFRGTSLSETLNRKEDTATASMRYAVTPLTTLVFQADARSDRFDLSHVRDADSIRLSPGVEFDTFALVTGAAYVGYRKFDARGEGVPGFNGVVASVDLAYTLLGRTRFSFQVSRDLAYSFEIAEPYYVLTGTRVSVRQKITRVWDVEASGGPQRLAYRSTQGLATGSGRVDNVQTFGGGVGYALGSSTRLGLNVDYYHRRSDRPNNDYSGLRASTSVTYGF